MQWECDPVEWSAISNAIAQRTTCWPCRNLVRLHSSLCRRYRLDGSASAGLLLVRSRRHAIAWPSFFSFLFSPSPSQLAVQIWLMSFLNWYVFNHFLHFICAFIVRVEVYALNWHLVFCVSKDWEGHSEAVLLWELGKRMMKCPQCGHNETDMTADNSFVYVINAEHTAKRSKVHWEHVSWETHDEKRSAIQFESPSSKLRRSVKESLWEWGGHHSRTELCAAVIDCPEQDAASVATSASDSDSATGICHSQPCLTLLRKTQIRVWVGDHRLLSIYLFLSVLVTVSSVTNEAILRRK